MAKISWVDYEPVTIKKESVVKSSNQTKLQKSKKSSSVKKKIIKKPKK